MVVLFITLLTNYKSTKAKTVLAYHCLFRVYESACYIMDD